MHKLTFFTLAALTASLSFGHTSTITPGTYKLEWKTLHKNEKPANGSGMRLYEPESLGIDTPKGIVSKNVLWANTELLNIFVDESKGTGSGYDVAYLFCNPWDLEDVMKQIDSARNLRDAIRVPLKKVNGKLVPKGPQDILIDVKMGLPNNRLSKKTPLFFCIEREYHYLVCYAYPMAQWTGAIKTNTGNLVIHTIDVDGNAVYNEDSVMSGFPDSVKLEPTSKPSKGMPQCIGEQSVRQPMWHSNKLYDINVNEHGNEVNIKPYTGDTGSLKFSAKSGMGKELTTSGIQLWSVPVVCESELPPPIEHTERTTHYFRYDFANADRCSLSLPTSRYGVSYSVPLKGDNRRSTGVLEFQAAEKERVQISSGSTVNVEAGGLIKATTWPEKTIEANWFDDVIVQLKTSDDKFLASVRGRNPSIKITDSKGKTVWTAKRWEDDHGPGQYGIFLPRKLKPGKYTFELTLDLWPYQSAPIVVKRPLVKK